MNTDRTDAAPKDRPFLAWFENKEQWIVLWWDGEDFVDLKYYYVQGREFTHWHDIATDLPPPGDECE